MTLKVGALILCETNEMVPFICKECEFNANTKQCIEHHLKEVHEIIKYYDCSQCLFTATSIRGLDAHVKKSHPTTNKYREESFNTHTNFLNDARENEKWT